MKLLNNQSDAISIDIDHLSIAIQDLPFTFYIGPDYYSDIFGSIINICHKKMMHVCSTGVLMVMCKP